MVQVARNPLALLGTRRPVDLRNTLVSWESAWGTADVEVLRSWFERYTGPSVPLNPVPLVGNQVVTTQAEADLLAGRIIEGGVSCSTNGIRLHDFVCRRTADSPVFAAVGNQCLIRLTGAVSITVDHVELDGRGVKSCSGIDGDGFTSVSVSYANIHHCGFDGLHLRQGLYEYVYIHDMWEWDDAIEGRPYNVANSQLTDPHTDGAQTNRDTFTWRRSFTDLTDAINMTGCFMIVPVSAPITNAVISDSYVNGGGFTFHIHNANLTLGNPGPNGDPTVTIRNVRCGRGYRLGLWAIHDVPPENLTRSNIVWADTLEPVPLANGPIA